MVIPKNRFLLLFVIAHDNGELCIYRNGCRGGEYYAVEDGIERLSEFLGFGYKIKMHLFFTKNDAEDGYYFPGSSIKKEWKTRLEDLGINSVNIDIANVETRSGTTRLGSFYHQRDLGQVGCVPSNPRTEKDLLANDEYFGVDSFTNNSLYKEYIKT